MSQTPQKHKSHCAFAQVVPKPVKEQVLQVLSDSGVPFEAVPDLCSLSAARDPSLAQLANGEELKIAACYPRAVRWLFSAADTPLPETGVQICNMRVDTAESVLQALLGTEPAPVPAGEGDL